MSGHDDRLKLALEHLANSPKSILTDLLGVQVRGNRCAAWWRGSTDDNVFVGDHAIMDRVSGESYGPKSILTELEGWSKEEAERVLLERASLIEGSTPLPCRRKPAPSKPQPPKVERAKGALNQWSKLPTTGTSPYLTRKGVDGSTCAAIRYDQGNINVVMSRISDQGELEPATVQTIRDDGTKRFAKGGSTRGVCALVGAATLADALAHGHVWIAEGLATALTVHAATSAPVLCVFMAGNLEPIVTTLRKLRKKSELAISIAADDDRYKPRTGNAGLEKAHHAALLHGCRVVSPTFADLRGKPTDFNDLQLLEGLQEVTKQLQASKLGNPAPANASETRKLARRGSGGRNIPHFELADGVTFVKSPQGTGKTEALRPLINLYQQEGKTVLYLTHRVALADDAARRLGLDVYSDEALREHLHMAPALAICVNSLHRLTDSKGKLQAFDIVILDESEQFIRALSGWHIANKDRNIKALKFVLEHAQKLVSLDADLGQLTEALARETRPHETWHRVEHYHPVGEGRTMRVHSKLDGVYAALRDLEGPIIGLTNSKREAEAMGAYLASLGKRGRVLTAERDADDALLMADLDAKTQDLDYLVCSPTVSTGVSLTSGHFKHVVGIFRSTVGTPEDALQALWRVRTSATYDVWLDPRTVTERIDLDAKHGALRAHERAVLGREVGQASPFYEALAQAAERFEQQAQATYRLGFLRLAALQGFGFEMLEDEGIEDLAVQARARAQELYRANVREARVLQPDEAAALATQSLKSKADRYALDRYRVVDFYHLTSADDLTHVLEVDHQGRYRKQLLRLERSLEDDARTLVTIDALIAEREMAADLPALVSLKEFHQELGRAVSFDGASQLTLSRKACQLDMPRYDSGSLEGFRHWIERNRPWLSGLIALPTTAKLKANIIRYVGSWLKTLGLRQKRTGKNDAQAYALEVENLEFACRTMKKRGTLSYKEHLEQSVPSDLPPETQLLETLRDMAISAAESFTRTSILESFALADKGVRKAAEALLFYAQKPDVRARMGF